MENEVLKLIKDHRSIRKFTKDQIDEKLLDEILDGARHASSHHNIQAYNIIKVKDVEKKKIISEIAANQKWIVDAPVFIIISMDYYRINQACKMYDKEIQVSELESVIIGAVDSALVGQNIMTIAESYGLGGVIIGGIRNNVTKLIQILELPEYTFPVFGICLGYPDPEQIPSIKPRFPKDAVIFDEKYNKEKVDIELEKYNEITQEYYTIRTNGNRTDSWSKQMSEYISKDRRPFIKEQLIQQGLKCK
jgi:nitroreductase